MSFLEAWARRKAQVRAEQKAAARRPAAKAGDPPHRANGNRPEQGPQAGATPQGISPASSPESDDEILARLGLPHPRELGPGDDFAAFMRPEIPAHLRRMALRLLWRSDPVLANQDNLLDYGEDFTISGKAGEVVRTAWRAGKGLLKDDDEALETTASSAARAPASADRTSAADAAQLPPAAGEASRHDDWAGNDDGAGNHAGTGAPLPESAADGLADGPARGIVRDAGQAPGMEQPGPRAPGGTAPRRRRLKFSFSEQPRSRKGSDPRRETRT